MDNPQGPRFVRILEDAFRKSGWRVEHEPQLGEARPDLVARKGKLAYTVELKTAPEGRRDRLIPLLSQAILQAQSGVRNTRGIAPLAVVASARIPEAVADEIRRFVREHAPGVAAGVMDLEGFKSFVGSGLESLNAPRKPATQDVFRKAKATPHLFSDLNQWMLKVLLAPQIPERLLAAPRGEYRNATQLAKAAGVSIMTAFRFLRLLENEGFLHESANAIRLVRIEELMRQWSAAYLRPARESQMRWILRGDPNVQLEQMLRSHAWQKRDPAAMPRNDRRQPLPRLCLGLFAAAKALGFGVVHGVKPHVYVDELRSDVARLLGLSRVEPGHSGDVYLRIPLAPESVFRGVVFHHGTPTSDILQVWLDVAQHPTRGEAQALEIQRGALSSLFAEKR